MHSWQENGTRRTSSTWQITQTSTWMPDSVTNRVMTHPMALLPPGIFPQIQETMSPVELRRDPYPPQQYVQERNLLSQGARVNLTRTTPRWTHDTTRVFPRSVQVPLRRSDLVRQALEATILRLHRHLVILSLWITPERAGSSMLFLQIRPSLRRSHLPTETVITRTSPTWRGLLQVARWCLSTTPQAERPRAQVRIINRRSSSFPQIKITLLETEMETLPEGHTLRPLVAMARTPPLADTTNAFMNAREILDILALY